jgi:hypothetical protein
MPVDGLRAACRQLAALRGKPCLLFACNYISLPTLLTVREALRKVKGDHLDLVILSPGGDIHPAYMIARDLRRRFKTVTGFVPLYAKSGATLICLVAQELILGDLGELGPIDVQVKEKQQGDAPAVKSSLERFKALEQLQRYSLETFNLVAQVGLRAKMRLTDAYTIAIEMTCKLMGPLYSQIDPDKIAQSARYLEIGDQYAERLLARYRPDVGDRKSVLRKLSRSYPTHDFVIDVEELREIGIPARVAAGKEVALIRRLETEILKLIEQEEEVIEVFEVAAKKRRATRKKPGAKASASAPALRSVP